MPKTFCLLPIHSANRDTLGLHVAQHHNLRSQLCRDLGQLRDRKRYSEASVLSPKHVENLSATNPASPAH